eukprot:1296869-Prymnesium_polylepis.1
MCIRDRARAGARQEQKTRARASARAEGGARLVELSRVVDAVKLALHLAAQVRVRLQSKAKPTRRAHTLTRGCLPPAHERHTGSTREALEEGVRSLSTSKLQAAKTNSGGQTNAARRTTSPPNYTLPPKLQAARRLAARRGESFPRL